jgi:hypothetical protein
MKRNKVIPADVAVSMVRDGWVLGAEGFYMCWGAMVIVVKPVTGALMVTFGT